MTENDYPDWGFGDMVTATVRGTEVEGEVVATGPDNRDLDDDQYIISIGGTDLMKHDDIQTEEIIRRSDVTDWRDP